MNTSNKIFGEHIRQFLDKKKLSVTRKFHVSLVQNGIVVVRNNGEGLYKKVCCTCIFFFVLIRSNDFVAVLITVAVGHHTILFFLFTSS